MQSFVRFTHRASQCRPTKIKAKANEEFRISTPTRAAETILYGSSFPKLVLTKSVRQSFLRGGYGIDSILRAQCSVLSLYSHAPHLASPHPIALSIDAIAAGIYRRTPHTIVNRITSTLTTNVVVRVAAAAAAAASFSQEKEARETGACLPTQPRNQLSVWLWPHRATAQSAKKKKKKMFRPRAH